MVAARAFVGLRPAPGIDLDGVLAVGGRRRDEPLRPRGVEHLLGFVPEGAPLDERLAHAETHLRTWRAEGFLRGDAAAGVDVVRLEDPDGSVAWGTVVLLDVHDERLLPHEAVVAGPADDRCRVRSRLGCDLAPVMLVRRDRSADRVRPSTLAAGPPLARGTDRGGVVHELWRIDEPTTVDAVLSGLADVDVLVADGHHRLAAARAHAASSEVAAAGWLLALVTEPDAAPRLRPSAPVTDLDEVWATASAGGVLPPKSTRFEPKPRAGLVLRPLAD